jgi:fibronectin type 3 domain-containing protein
MKQLFAVCLILAGASAGLAQGFQGNVTISGSAIVPVTGHSVTLTWSSSSGAVSYNVYRGTTSGGPYLKVGSEIITTTYADVQVTHAQTFYYVTTAVSGSNESGYSNEVTALIP